MKTLEEQKRIEAVAAKAEYTDKDKAELLADLHDWLKPVFAKLPDFSRKIHGYKLAALRKMVAGFGGKTEPDPEPGPDVSGEEE